MTPIYLIGLIGAQEIGFLVAILALYVLPIWLSFRIYGRHDPHWRDVSVFACLLAGWLGFLIVRGIRAGIQGYVEGRYARKPRSSTPPR